MSIILENKKLHLEYEIKETFEAGIALTGNEVKSIRNGKAEMRGARIIIKNMEAYLIGLNVSVYQINKKEEDKNKKNDRIRKLLLKKKQLQKLSTIQNEKSANILAEKIYDSHGMLKLSIAICKKQNKHDKRETIRKKDDKRIKD